MAGHSEMALSLPALLRQPCGRVAFILPPQLVHYDSTGVINQRGQLRSPDQTILLNVLFSALSIEDVAGRNWVRI